MFFQVATALIILALGAGSYFCGYCFGKSDGMRYTREMYESHLKKFVDPLIERMKEYIEILEAKESPLK